MSSSPKISSLLLVVALFLPAALAQRRNPVADTTKHTLYGDLNIDESQAGAPSEGDYRVILANLNGTIVARQSVGKGGRYRFLEVANGDYFLIVELAGKEVMRTQFLLQEMRSTDIRKDLDLIWTSHGVASAGNSSPVYARSGKNKQLWENAEKARNQGKAEDATRFLQELTSNDESDYEAWTELGSLLYLQKKVDPAEKAYRSALKARPDYPLAGLNLGKLLYGKRKFDEAIELFEKVLSGAPNLAEAHMFLGECYLQIKKGSKAVPHLEEALELEPMKMAEAHMRLATLYRAAGYSDRAIAEYKQYLEKRPDTPRRKEIEDYIKKNQ